jgi:hypothetical protein
MTTSVGWGWGSSGVTPSEIQRAEQEETLSRIRRGMAVYDTLGQRIGSVREVYRAPGDGAFWMGVRTGWFGLGRELSIPLVYANVWENHVGLSVSRRVIDRMGWDQRPTAAQPVTQEKAAR